MKHLPILALLVLCIAISECHILNFRREMANYEYNGHLLNPYQDLWGGKHGKHGLRRWRRHHGSDAFGYAPGFLEYLGQGFGDYYPHHHHHKGRGLWRNKRRHGRRH
uniref:Uncharacterized protein n=1 Tax=Aedes aegypti TaxID=7159 RepID=A0A903VTQ6_AEDAE